MIRTDSLSSQLIIQNSSNRFFSGMKDRFLSRRRYLQVSALAGGSMLLGGQALAKEEAGAVNSIEPGPAIPQAAGELWSLVQRLAKAPRRRDFKTVPTDTAAHEDPSSVFGPAGNTIPALQQRGVVFLACHNAVWEQTAKLLEKGINPDKLSHEALAAELTNHLIEGVVLTPGIVGTIPELQKAGFDYAK
jgi:intracellular sulfur oxidation DsrE/DsrF family protein